MSIEQHRRTVEAMEEELDRPARAVGARGARPNRGPEAITTFESLGEFIHAVRFNPTDQRLSNLYFERDGDEGPRGEQRTDDGASGGFMIPTQFRAELMQVQPTAAVMRPRCLVLAAGSPPDGELIVPALDQSPATNMYGGVTVAWIGEGGLKPDTDAKIREVTLRPQEIAGSIRTTDKLLRNWTAAADFLGGQLRKAVIGAEDAAFLTGNGVAKPMGVLNSSCRIEINRAVSGAVSYADVLAMDETLLGVSPRAFWTCSKRTRTQLRQLKNPAGYYIWQEDARQSGPAILMGHEVVITDRCPELGSRGDLMLIDGAKYLIKDGSGPFVAMSEHVYFLTNETVIKIFWNVDGQGWLKSPVKVENGDLETAFVVLN